MTALSPANTLFDIEEALPKRHHHLLPAERCRPNRTLADREKNLTPGKALYFSHGFGITFNEQTGIIPPKDVDVFLVAPKGSGTSLRRMFLAGPRLQ